MSYWDETERYLLEHDGKGPTCPHCEKEMFPVDDHGRFECFCDGGILDMVSATPEIPQVDTQGMTDKEKAEVPPISRLFDVPTSAEAEVLGFLLMGPAGIDNPEYQDAIARMERERKKK